MAPLEVNVDVVEGEVASPEVGVHVAFSEVTISVVDGVMA